MLVVQIAVYAALLIIFLFTMLRSFDRKASPRATGFGLGFVVGIAWTLVLVLI
jgi:hypothetical protein